MPLHAHAVVSLDRGRAAQWRDGEYHEGSFDSSDEAELARSNVVAQKSDSEDEDYYLLDATPRRVYQRPRRRPPRGRSRLSGASSSSSLCTCLRRCVCCLLCIVVLGLVRKPLVRVVEVLYPGSTARVTGRLDALMQPYLARAEPYVQPIANATLSWILAMPIGDPSPFSSDMNPMVFSQGLLLPPLAPPPPPPSPRPPPPPRRNIFAPRPPPPPPSPPVHSHGAAVLSSAHSEAHGAAPPRGDTIPHTNPMPQSEFHGGGHSDAHAEGEHAQAVMASVAAGDVKTGPPDSEITSLHASLHSSLHHSIAAVAARGKGSVGPSRSDSHHAGVAANQDLAKPPSSWLPNAHHNDEEEEEEEEEEGGEEDQEDGEHPGDDNTRGGGKDDDDDDDESPPPPLPVAKTRDQVKRPATSTGKKPAGTAKMPAEKDHEVERRVVHKALPPPPPAVGWFQQNYGSSVEKDAQAVEAAEAAEAPQLHAPPPPPRPAPRPKPIATSCVSEHENDVPNAQCQAFCRSTAARGHCSWCKCRKCSFCQELLLHALHAAPDAAAKEGAGGEGSHANAGGDANAKESRGARAEHAA